jgi:hypothetical protein
LNYRELIKQVLGLLSSPSQQLEYEKEVTQADVVAELISSFCDDIYHPKNSAFIEAFSNDELLDLARLYGLMNEASRHRAQSVSALLKQDEWRRVVALASEISGRL